MLKNPTPLLLLACACGLSTGCGNQQQAQTPAPPPAAAAQPPAPMGPRHNHSDEPIIIDNPKAFIGFLKNLDEVGYVLGPFDDDQTFVFDHSRPAFIRIAGKDNGKPIPLTDPMVTLVFRKNKGAMIIDHVGPEKGGTLIIRPGSSKRSLKWKRQEPDNSNGKDRLGLVAKSGLDTYEIESVAYWTAAGDQKHIFPEDEQVRIRVCVQSGDTYCPPFN